MTQPPQGPPPGGYPPPPPDGGYPPPPADGGYGAPADGAYQSPPERGSLPPQGSHTPSPDAGYAAAPEGAYVPPAAGAYPPVEAYPVDPQYPPGYASAAPLTPPQPRRGTPIIAPVLAFVALVVVGAASLFLVSFLNTSIDSAATEASLEPEVAAAAAPSTEPDQTEEPAATDEPVPTDAPEPTDDGTAGAAAVETPEPEPEETAEPITVVPPSDERADVPGSILFTRLGGDIWAASGTTMSSLTNSSSIKADSSPTWSPDGRHIYFIRSTKREVKDGRARLDGKYTLYPTDLMRMQADGSDRKRIFASLIKDSRGEWFSHVLQPSVSSGGNNVAVVSDGSDGAGEGVELHIVNSKSGRMRKVDTESQPTGTIRLGHNDPDFSPDGKQIAFTYNDNAGTEGDPRIGILTCQTKAKCTSGKTKLLKSGYANPSWSPSGKLLAVETTDSTGRDIAIIAAKGGFERVRLTNDGNSFAPEFSPNGDQIAYLKRAGLGIDVRVMTLEIDDRGKISLVDDRPVTSDGEVDGESGLSWYIPKSERSRSVDQAEETSEGATDEDLLEGAPPPPPGS